MDVPDLWRSAFLVELAMAITVAEWLGLLAYHRLTGRGLASEAYAWNLVSGLCLMLALRFALLGQGALWGTGCLVASGVAHLCYLRQRWLRASARPIRPS